MTPEQLAAFYKKYTEHLSALTEGQQSDPPDGTDFGLTFGESFEFEVAIARDFNEVNRPSKYANKLLDPRWQKKRLEVLNAAGWKCSRCGASDKTLHVHHPHYIAGREPWDYDDLISLCDDCHKAEHPDKQRKPKC